MNNQPKITVITASYNYEKYIGEAITSVINQTYSNWELLVIDDGSKDNSIQVIQEFCRKDSRIKLLTHENNANKGLPETIKLGLNRASGEYIAFLESDDIWHKDNLSEKVKALEKYNGADFIFNGVEYFGCSQAQENMRAWEENFIKYLTSEKDSNKILRHELIINHVATFSCAMVRTETIKKCNFVAPFKAYLDWWLWSQVFAGGKVVYLEKKLTYWRKHEDSYLQTSKIDYTFRSKLTKLIFKNQRILNFIYALINKKRIQKLFRPQVNKLNNILVDKMIRNSGTKLEFYTIVS